MGPPPPGFGYHPRPIVKYTINIIDCYSTGNITDNAGGICGAMSGGIGSGINITNCYSIGNISGNAGGIAASECSGSINSSFIITNCYSKGTISGNSGGIAGSKAGNRDFPPTIPPAFPIISPVE